MGIVASLRHRVSPTPGFIPTTCATRINKRTHARTCGSVRARDMGGGTRSDREGRPGGTGECFVWTNPAPKITHQVSSDTSHNGYHHLTWSSYGS